MGVIAEIGLLLLLPFLGYRALTAVMSVRLRLVFFLLFAVIILLLLILKIAGGGLGLWVCLPLLGVSCFYVWRRNRDKGFTPGWKKKNPLDGPPSFEVNERKHPPQLPSSGPESNDLRLVRLIYLDDGGAKRDEQLVAQDLRRGFGENPVLLAATVPGHERREIPLSAIQDLYSPLIREYPGDPLAYLEWVVKGAEGAAIACYWDELVVLLYLAQADGAMGGKEYDIVRRFLRGRTRFALDDDRLQIQLEELAPMIMKFYGRAISRLEARTDFSGVPLLEAARSLVAVRGQGRDLSEEMVLKRLESLFD